MIGFKTHLNPTGPYFKPVIYVYTLFPKKVTVLRCGVNISLYAQSLCQNASSMRTGTLCACLSVVQGSLHYLSQNSYGAACKEWRDMVPPGGPCLREESHPGGGRETG